MGRTLNLYAGVLCFAVSGWCLLAALRHLVHRRTVRTRGDGGE